MMRRTLLLCLLVAFLLPFITNANLPFIEKDGEPVASLNLELRPRWELDGRDFNNDTGISDYGSMRSMIGIDITPMDNFLVRFSVQENRFLGTQPPGHISDSIWNAQEAFFRMDNLFDADVALQAGRFMFQTGRGRIFGYNDWDFYGPNAYDGFLIEWPCLLNPESGRWTLLAARVTDFDYGDWLFESQTPYETPAVWGPLYGVDRRDRNLFVLSGNFMGGVVQPFVSADLDSREDVSTFIFDYMPGSRYHTGVYVGDTWDRVRFNVDAVYQWGELNNEQILVDETGREIGTYQPTLKSWLLAADVTYDFDLPANPTWMIGFDRTNGTWDMYDPVRVQNYPYFMTPFRSYHKFNGLMDIEWQFQPRTTDLFTSLSFDPSDKQHVELTYHRFLINQEHYEESDESFDVGHEIDGEWTWQTNNYLEISAGYSTFVFNDPNIWGLFAKRINESRIGGFANFHDDSADYAWLQATVRF